MCGITGIFRFDEKTIDIEEAISFNNSLTHRGPDAGAVVAIDSALVLGHRRLAIVDLDTQANQPMHSQCGRYVITFNGEIYNFLELRKELCQLGYTFNTRSDTEVILAAYDYWHQDCLNKFNGMWAFCIWDKTTKTLFASRDRFGVKPFYYFLNESFLAFSSEQKAFAELAEVGLEINPSIAAFAVANPTVYEATDTALYSNVYRLGPGECMWVNPQGQIQKNKWWDAHQQYKLSVDVDGVIGSFEHACEIRTRTDVDIAFSLSGGMDSSSVLSYTSPILKTRLKRSKAFIGSFPNTNLDEYADAKLVAESNRIEHMRVVIPDNVSPEDIISCMVQSEDVMRDPPIGQWYIYRAMNESGFKVSLEGHGGDELLGGYTQHVEAHLGDCISGRYDVDEIAHTICLIDRMRSAIGYGSLNLPLIIRRSVGLDYSFDKVGFLTQFMKADKAQSTIRDLATPESIGGSLLDASLFNDFTLFTLPTILRNYDKASMGHSVEVRSPFLDWQFVLQARALPNTQKIIKGRTKVLLRESFKKVPESIRKNDTKLGFNFPLSKWIKDTYSIFLSEVLSDSLFLQNSLFDGKKVANAVLKNVEHNNWQNIQLFWPLIHLTILNRYICRR